MDTIEIAETTGMTGAGSGIGTATSLELLKKGQKVYGLAWRREK